MGELMIQKPGTGCFTVGYTVCEGGGKKRSSISGWQDLELQTLRFGIRQEEARRKNQPKTTMR